jgi:hypothetical protein
VCLYFLSWNVSVSNIRLKRKIEQQTKTTKHMQQKEFSSQIFVTAVGETVNGYIKSTISIVTHFICVVLLIATNSLSFQRWNQPQILIATNVYA